MTQAPSNLVDVIAAQISALQDEREGLLRRVMEIDDKLGGIAAQLGIEVPAAAAGLPRLPLPEVADKRHIGSLPEAMMDTLLHAERGYSRSELKRVLREGPVGETVKKNENTYYNAVKRYLAAGKIVEIEGLLYHPDRAPLPDGQEDPTGQHLPSNVSSLFAGERRAINLDD